ncbi:MAG TPA: RDD family protein [Sedimenticola sp.]|nr:RDD family protein [Sedimenticola sp.]
MTIDTTLRHETPEGVVLVMRLAGPVVRAWAWVIDLLIRAGLYLVLAVPLSFLGGIGTAGTLIGLFLIEWFYPVLFEVRNGATPGKRMMGLLVLHDNGSPVALPAALLRNLLRGADFLPFLYGAGLLSMLINREFKRLGDMAAGTLVVYREPAHARASLPDVPPLPLPVALTSDEQRLLITFAERAPALAQGRRLELAETLGGLTGRHGVAGVERLYAYANWLARGH